MTNNEMVTTPTPTPTRLNSDALGQTVMVVNGRESAMGLLEAVLDSGRYDVVFVESTDHAYSHIKRVQPNLVILCTRIEDMDGLQVLSMLKLDKDTCDIPVLTYASDLDENDTDEDDDDTTGMGVDVFTPPVIDR
ncbi:MAG: two-component system response regulator, partial [Vicinamibacterales bacterium]